MDSDCLKDIEVKSEPAEVDGIFPDNVAYGEYELSYDIKEEIEENSCHLASQDCTDVDIECSNESPQQNVFHGREERIDSNDHEELKAPTEPVKNGSKFPENEFYEKNWLSYEFKKEGKKKHSSDSESHDDLNSRQVSDTRTNSKPYQCYVCNKFFSKSSLLKMHFRIHTKGKPYKCTLCEKSFASPSHLKDHLNIHTNEKPYKCNICDKSFAQSSTLKHHSKTHTKEKPYQCEVCNKAFAQSSILKRHVMIHTKEKPFKCDVCNRPFARNSTLKDHLKTHTDNKSYPCEICYRSFTRSSSLREHLRVHTKEKPYLCEVCNKSFSQYSSLHSHSKIHTMEKSYQCDICNEKFSKRSKLKIHLKIHENSGQFDPSDEAFPPPPGLTEPVIYTKDKSFHCDVCNQVFSRSSILNRHSKSHTKVKHHECYACN